MKKNLQHRIFYSWSFTLHLRCNPSGPFRPYPKNPKPSAGSLILVFLFCSLYTGAQSSITRIPDLIYGETECYRTSYPYPNTIDVGEIIAPLISEAYFNRPGILELTLDLYLPKSRESASPLLVLAHDSAFQVGDKGDPFMQYLGESLARQGVVVASVNYGLGFQVSKAKALGAIHTAVQNIRGAIRFLLSKKEEYGINPQRIYVGGVSAGGIAALTTAFLEEGEYPDFVRDQLAGSQFFECLDCNTNRIKHPFTVYGVISMWGGVTDIQFVDNKIQTLLIHGNEDMTVPYEYGYPFETLGFHNKSSGRLIFDPVYGSKRIKDQLGEHATLVTLQGKPHSPQYVKGKNELNMEVAASILGYISSFISKQK